MYILHEYFDCYVKAIPQLQSKYFSPNGDHTTVTEQTGTMKEISRCRWYSKTICN